MKTLGANNTTHVAQEVTTLALCWKCTREDGQIFGFTSHDRDVSVSGVVYKAATGFSASQLQWNSDLAVDNLEVLGALDSSAITEDDLRAGIWDFALVEIFMVNYASPTDGPIKQTKGRLGEVRRGRTSFSGELRGLAQALQQQHGRSYSPACDADLGDARCGVDLGPLTVSSTITGLGASPRRVFADSTRSEADGYFDAGKITFMTGANAGFSIEVKSYVLTGGVVTAQLPLPYDVSIGDSYEMTPGCLKRLDEDCLDKFNNVINFRGFPHLPGLDQLVSGKRENN